MADVTYYWNSYTGGGWNTTPENMVDGSIDTDAVSNTNDQEELCDANECAGTNLGTITKVEVRTYGHISGGASQIRTIPVFGGISNGDEHQMSNFPEAWSSYVDITTDTNAPVSWAWTDVQALDMIVKAYINGGSCYVARVEMKVTYTPGEPPPASQQPAQQTIVIM